jgi:fumarate hydratase class II
MHLAAREVTLEVTVPGLARLQSSLHRRSVEWAGVLKVGRTHLMDAVPIAVGDEWSGYAAALTDSMDWLTVTLRGLDEVALGGTAVGTGINAPPGFAPVVVERLASLTGAPLVPARNPFAARATLDPLVRAHAALRAVAVTVYKIADDLRWMASGPYAGLGELRVPAQEPGSTIMPGKVNPTQAEATLMACLLVLGNDVTIGSAGAEGNFELNAFRPLVISTYLRSARTLGEAAGRLASHLIEGSELDQERLGALLDRSVMVLTALAPSLGHETVAAMVRDAVERGTTAREAALRHGVTEEQYDAAMTTLLSGPLP